MTPTMAVLGWAAMVAGILVFRTEIGHWNGPTTAAGVLLILFGGPIGLLATILLIWGTTFLDIDPAAGTARFVNLGKVKWSSPLAELGAVTITEKARAGLRNQRFVWFELQIAGHDEILFTSSDRAAVEERRALIERLAAIGAVRKILSTVVTGVGGFRDAPDVVVQAKQAVHDPARLSEAVKALVRDHDAEVRARASELQTALERG